MYIGLHVTYTLFLPDINQTWNYSTYFRKIFKYENPSSGSRAVSCGRTDGRRNRHDETI